MISGLVTIIAMVIIVIGMLVIDSRINSTNKLLKKILKELESHRAL